VNGVNVYIAISQTVPTAGAATIAAGAIKGTLSGSASNATISWPASAQMTIGPVTYTLNFGTAGVAPTSTNAGQSSIIGTVTDTALGVPPQVYSGADIDGNGATSALTDGLLLLRYLFGLRGDALLGGAVGASPYRQSAAQIESYLQTLAPPAQ
jgi:hypothetical protein